MDPLIVTATLDAVSACVFGDLRRRYFPAGRNIVPAHLTLFHQLPGDRLADCLADMETERPPFGVVPFATGALRFLGRGVAIDIACPALEAVRHRLAVRWAEDLTPQDRQRFRPHVTIQNKVSSQEARATFAALTSGLAPVSGAVTGLDVWWYRGGPWQAAGGIRWAVPERLSNTVPDPS